jgi:hypothetical protein
VDRTEGKVAAKAGDARQNRETRRRDCGQRFMCMAFGNYKLNRFSDFDNLISTFLVNSPRPEFSQKNVLLQQESWESFDHHSDNIISPNSLISPLPHETNPSWKDLRFIQ